VQKQEDIYQWVKGTNKQQAVKYVHSRTTKEFFEPAGAVAVKCGD